jgi:type IV secretory pathway VirB2 component (pilin)
MENSNGNCSSNNRSIWINKILNLKKYIFIWEGGICMKTMYKVFAILMIAVSMFVIMPNNTSFAADTAGKGAQGAIDNISVSEPTAATAGLAGTIGKLLGFLQVASGLVAVLMIAIVGFNYIVSTPEVKDEMKKKLLPIIIGIVLVFGATSIAKFLIGVAG